MLHSNKLYYSKYQEATTSLDGSEDSVPFRQNRKSRQVYSTYIPNHRFSRYYNTLLSCLPYRLKQNDELSVQNSGLFSFITFHWIYTYLWRSNKDHIEISIPLCPKSESCTTNSSRLNGLLDSQIVKEGQNNLSIFKVVWQFMRTRTIFASILYILGSLMSMLGLIYFLPNILPHTTYQNQIYDVYGWLLALLCSELLSCLFTSFSNAINLKTAIRLRSACFSSLYRQTMLTSLTYNISSWQLASFLLADGQNVHDLVMTFPNLICTPFILLFCMLLAGIHLGLWGYMSVVIIVFLFPIFIIIAILSRNLLNKATFFSDQRIKLLEDFIIHNIYVKLFKKEEWFQKNITEKRENEVKNMKRAGLYDNICFSFILLQPFLSLAALFVAYSSDYIENKKIGQFAAISIILIIHVKQSLDNFWHGLNNFIKGLAALNKFKKIMSYETINFNHKKPKNSNIAIHIEDANFQWTKQITLDVNSSTANILCSPKNEFIKLGNKIPIHDILHDITMVIEQGKLIGICGLPGSGKSSLLLAIMGLLLQRTGIRKTIGSFAYTNQDPIIFHDTVKNNILFGNELDSYRYCNVIMHCELQDFISLLLQQDDTFIESKSLTLEQKQCIAFARALYEDREIYVLDEPFSALDPFKSLKIFDNCVKKLLQQKTILLATDNVELLEQCDEIFMLQHGQIFLQGQHENLLTCNSEYAEFIEYLKKQRNIFREKSTNLEIKAIPRNLEDNKLQSFSSHYSIFNSTDLLSVNEEDNLKNTNEYSDDGINIFKYYFLHFGFGSILVLFLMQIINVIFISFLPVYFIFSLENRLDVLYLFTYFGLFSWMLISGVVTNYYFNNKMFSASVRIYNEILEKLYKTSLAFLQAKSLSIISIISIQLQLTDIDIPQLIHNIFLNLFIALMTSCVIIFASPWYTFAVLIVFIIMIICTIFIRKVLLPFNQFGMDYNDILYTQVMSMLMARPIIQAYNKINHFSNRLYASYDKYITYLYIVNAAKSWLNFVLRCLTVILLIAVSYISILLTPECTLGSLKLFNSNFTCTRDTSNNLSKCPVDLSCMALAIVCTLQACYVLQKTLEFYLQTGLAFDVLSKVQLFQKNIIKEENRNDEHNKIELTEKAYGIKFINVSVNDDIPVIYDMSFKIQENEKIGFFGLSSSERKAIIAILYKFTNQFQGNVLIGNTNISHICLKNVRSLISVIPSEPYLFNISIKKILTVSNGLPENVIEVLKKFLLIERISSLPNKIDSVADQLLNTEEKQLLCLAQAYIKQSPIIIIEDFVNGSNLDYIISTQIKQLFPQSTVLIFANNVASLRNCDNISVFHKGKLIYTDNAANTIANLLPQSTVFNSSVPETNF